MIPLFALTKRLQWGRKGSIMNTSECSLGSLTAMHSPLSLCSCRHGAKDYGVTITLYRNWSPSSYTAVLCLCRCWRQWSATSLYLHNSIHVLQPLSSSSSSPLYESQQHTLLQSICSNSMAEISKLSPSYGGHQYSLRTSHSKNFLIRSSRRPWYLYS